MPTTSDLDLARALVAHPRWRWAAGMRAVCTWTPTDGGMVIAARLSVFAEQAIGWTPDEPPEAVTDDEGNLCPYVPDLADAATAGVLLDQIDAPIVTTQRRHDPPSYRVQWQVGPPCSTPWVDTLGEAAARALLALWGPA